MDIATATILSCHLSRVTDAVEKLNVRARKLGAMPYVLVSSDPYIREYRNELTGLVVKRVEMIDVAVAGEPVKFNGWTFAAKLDFLSDDATGCIVSKAPGFESLEVERPDGTRCDHCRTSRRRAVCYVVQHDNGARKVVGSSCVADFTGITRGVERLVALGFDAASVFEGSDEWEGGRGSNMIDVAEYLTAVAAMIRAYGWLSRTTANERGEHGQATADQAGVWLGANAKDRREGWPKMSVTRSDRACALRSMHWAAQLAGDSDYDANIRAIASVGYCKPAHMGLAASIVSSWLRVQERANERAKRVPVNDNAIAGAIGDKLHTFVEVVSKREIADDYGVTTIVRMTEVDTGATIVWFASSDTSDLVERERVQVRATVKKLTEYKGTRQTVVTRLTVPRAWCAPKKVRKPRVAKTA